MRIPKVSIIVCHYGETMVDVYKKQVNTRELMYSAKSKQVIFEGGSGEGKTSQLNRALRKAKGSIIVVSDCDAYIKDGYALKKIVDHFKDPDVAVVGGYVEPENVIWIEKIVWKIGNYLRVHQTKRGLCSHVCAPLYAFRRGFIKQFPEDCIADDVHVAMKANFEDKKVIYDETIKVKELRGPKTWRDWVWHKHRKSNAFLRELLRYAYRLPYPRKKWRLKFLILLLAFLGMAGWNYTFFNQTSNYRRI